MSLNNFNGSERDPSLVHSEESISASRTLSEDMIPLLEERLMVNLTRRKVGEVVVRKEIETHILQVQVPVRREKLIVEQVLPEYKRLAEVDLGQVCGANKAVAESTDDLGIAQIEQHFQSHSLKQDSHPTVYGETHSPQIASDLLDMIAHMPSHNCEAIKIQIVLKDSMHQDTYQALFDRNCEA
jgi:Domain of unknown function (DUF2382)